LLFFSFSIFDRHRLRFVRHEPLRQFINIITFALLFFQEKGGLLHLVEIGMSHLFPFKPWCVSHAPRIRKIYPALRGRSERVYLYISLF
jgi:hypothetical protein